MEGYTAFNKIKRYQELQLKGGRRTPEEELLFRKLGEDPTIKPYIVTPNIPSA